MAMTPEERLDLIEKIDAKLKDMTDDDLQALAVEHDIEVESAAQKMTKDGPAVIPPMIDTSVLTGPVNSLKSFLMKKTAENDIASK